MNGNNLDFYNFNEEQYDDGTWNAVITFSKHLIAVCSRIEEIGYSSDDLYSVIDDNEIIKVYYKNEPIMEADISREPYILNYLKLGNLDLEEFLEYCEMFHGVLFFDERADMINSYCVLNTDY